MNPLKRMPHFDETFHKKSFPASACKARAEAVPPGSEGDSRLAEALIPRGFPGAF